MLAVSRRLSWNFGNVQVFYLHWDWCTKIWCVIPATGGTSGRTSSQIGSQINNPHSANSQRQCLQYVGYVYFSQSSAILTFTYAKRGYQGDLLLWQILSTVCSNKLDTLSNMISFIRKDSIYIKSYSWYIKLPHMKEDYNNDSLIIIIQRTTNIFGQRQWYMLDTAKL